MSLKALIVALALGILAWPSAGHAEKATTNQPTTVFSRAGEQAPVILKVPAGQLMTVIAKDGRWIKVRVSGRTGWVPRTKVDLPKETDDLARQTRSRPFVDGRGTTRGFNGERGPDDRIGADATGEGAEPGKGEKVEPGEKGEKVATGEKGEKGEKPAAVDPKPGKGEKGEKPAAVDPKPGKGEKGEKGEKPAAVDPKQGKGEKGEKGETTAKVDPPDEPGDDPSPTTRPIAHVSKTTTVFNAPSAKSASVFTAQPKTALYIGEQNGKWTFVENDEGDPGYVLTSELKVERMDGTKGELAMDGPRRRMMDIRAGVGVAFLRQAFATQGSTSAVPPDNYAAQSPSILASLGASLMFPFGGRGWFGTELGYDYNKALPGAQYNGQTTSFSYQILNFRLALGLDLKRPSGAILLVRAGVHYDAFQVPDFADFTKNTITLPNQNIFAPTIGGALVVPRLGQKVSFRLSVDAIAFGASVQQTKNLEDGINPDAKAVFLGLGLGYRIGPSMVLQTTYDLGYTAVSFGGPPPTTSLRQHMGTVMSGNDFNNLLSLSALYGF
jgi:Bacterial SH3 domain